MTTTDTPAIAKTASVYVQATVKLLDYGYVRLIDHMGSDESIIEAARMSTGKGFKGWGELEICSRCNGRGTNEPENGPGSLCKQCHGGTARDAQGRSLFVNKPGDEKLLTHLYENRHDTPFEMGEMIIEVKAPIFVFREWHRHRVQSYNEMSARYTPLPDENYSPSVDRCLVVNAKNKQAARADGAGELTHTQVLAWLERLHAAYALSQEVYEEGLKIGIPKEIARCPVPVARYSVMRAKTDLRNWLAFLTLRSDDNAQWEIRQYAYAVGHFISGLFPRTWDLYLNHDRKKPVIDKYGFVRIVERQAA